MCEPDFVGWTGLGPVALLIENVLGLRVEGRDRHVSWRLSRTDRHGIERLQAGEAEISLLGEQRPSPASVAAITVTASKRITLTLVKETQKQTLQFEPGTHQIQF